MAEANQWDRPMQTRPEDSATHTTILTPDEARSGVVSGRIRLLLAAILTLVVVAFAVVYAVHV